MMKMLIATIFCKFGYKQKKCWQIDYMIIQSVYVKALFIPAIMSIFIRINISVV